MQFLAEGRPSRAAALIVVLRDRARSVWPWFAALWLGGVGTVALISFGLRLWIAPK